MPDPKCPSCDYDLRGQPLHDGSGVCPECGSTFRLADLLPVEWTAKQRSWMNGFAIVNVSFTLVNAAFILAFAGYMPTAAARYIVAGWLSLIGVSFVSMVVLARPNRAPKALWTFVFVTFGFQNLALLFNAATAVS